MKFKTISNHLYCSGYMLFEPYSVKISKGKLLEGILKFNNSNLIRIMDIFKDPVHLSKGINLQELLNGHVEFHIDANFKNSSDVIDGDLMPDSDDNSDSEDYLTKLEDSTSQLMLSSPNYMNFTDLAAKMIDCVPSGDVKMMIIEEGNGPLVPLDAVVLVHYAAYYENATIPFDSTTNMNSGEPMKLRLGTSGIIPGLEVGLTCVKGPKARLNLLLQPRAAWGPYGAPPRILPEPVLFVIILYDVEDTQIGARFNDLPIAQQKKFEVTERTVKSVHSQAKSLFAKKRYGKAIKCYQRSISILSICETNSDEEYETIKKLKIKSYVNLAVCYYNINKPKYIINMCECLDFITDIDRHCKALFYYGRAYNMLGKQEKAVEYYKKALKLEPKNEEIAKALADLDKYNKKSADEEKEIWQNAFLTKQKKSYRDVDEDFRNSAQEMCEDLAARSEYSKVVLPNGLMKDEVHFLKDLCDQFGLIMSEDGEGKTKHVSIIKQTS